MADEFNPEELKNLIYEIQQGIDMTFVAWKEGHIPADEMMRTISKQFFNAGSTIVRYRQRVNKL